MKDKETAKAYWKANQTLIAILLAIWALVGYVFPIFLAVPMEKVSVGKLPMSFWWAQQGSMYVFVILIFVYAYVMDRIDRKYGVGEKRGRP
jgi:putative solute:sodium symporter small subunit